MGRKMEALALGTAAGIILTGCGSGSVEQSGREVTPVPSVMAPPPATQQTRGEVPQEAPVISARGAVFTFDDMIVDPSMGADPTILVYHGPGESLNDHQPYPKGNWYKKGDRVPVECGIDGRDVSTDTVHGERQATSHAWFRLTAQNGEHPFATATYGNVSMPMGQGLPLCVGATAVAPPPTYYM